MARTLAFLLSTGALVALLPLPASHAEPPTCEGAPFPAIGFAAGAVPPPAKYRSDSPKPYILARALSGEIRVTVTALDETETCRSVCSSPLKTLEFLTCPVRIVFPGRPAFVEVTGDGVFLVCEAQNVPERPCS